MSNSYYLKELRLHLTSPFKTPWQSDIVFGHLAWSYREKHGVERLQEWLKQFKDGNPPYVFSDGFITNQFPRPMIPPPERKENTKIEKIVSIKQGKAMKKKKFFHRNDFQAFMEGKNLSILEELDVTYKSSVSVHNSISRISGTSLDENGLYEEELFFLKSKNVENQDTLSIFVRFRDKESEKEFIDLLTQISLEGYGKKKTTGFGQFTFNLMKEDECIWMEHIEEANGIIWLSHGVPSVNDPTTGWYKLDTKYGKLAGKVSDKGNLYKKPLTRIIPGAIFITDYPQPFYGRMIENISTTNVEVLQYGYALALPIKLPEYICI